MKKKKDELIPMREKLQKEIDKIHEGIKYFFLKDGYIDYMVFIIDYKGHGTVIINDQGIDKDTFANKIRELAAEKKAIAVIFAAEGYTVDVRKNEDFKKKITEIIQKYGSISKCPQRIRILSIKEDYFDGVYDTTYAIIKKGDKFDLKIKHPTTRSDREDVKGRFTNLLNKPTGEDFDRMMEKIQEEKT